MEVVGESTQGQQTLTVNKSLSYGKAKSLMRVSRSDEPIDAAFEVRGFRSGCLTQVSRCTGFGSGALSVQPITADLGRSALGCVT
jgi:hypothetical protein